MPERLTDIPADWRSRSVASDPELLPEEKELSINFPNDLDTGTVYTDIPVFIKWLQSIEPAAPAWLRVDADGAIIAAEATIPKGILKLQSQARQSNTHSTMASYGDQRE